MSGPTGRFRPPRGRGSREAAATRILAHRLFHRADARGEEPDLDTALRLVDERLAPAAESRRRVADEAHRLARTAFAERRRGGRLEGHLRSSLQVPLRGAAGAARVVSIPTVIHHPDDTLSVVTLAAAGDDAERRARRSRAAARAFFGRPVRALLVHADGTIRTLSPGRQKKSPTGERVSGGPPSPTRSERRGGRSRGRGYSGSGRRRSARTPR